MERRIIGAQVRQVLNDRHLTLGKMLLQEGFPIPGGHLHRLDEQENILRPNHSLHLQRI